MRVVMRILLVEFSLAWAMVVAGWMRAGLQAVPFVAGSVVTTWRRVSWGPVLGLLIGTPIVAGWPLMFDLVHSEPRYHLWMRAIAIPWWIVLGCGGGMFLAARAARSQAESQDR
jgi:hypothetical protein